MAIKKVKSPDGVTRWMVTASKRDRNNKRYQRKRFASNMPQAKAMERQLFEELEAEISGKPLVTWGEFVEVYYTEMVDKKQKSTLEDEKHSLEKHVNPRWRDRLLRDFTQRDVTELLNEAVGNKSAQTKKHLATRIRSVFRLAQAYGYITKNPAEGITFKIERQRKVLPSYEQMKDILRRAKERNLPWYPLWHFLALTGCRSGEAICVTPDKVSLKDRTIMIDQTWTRRGGFRPAAKNGEWRTIPINEELERLLVTLEAMRKETPERFTEDGVMYLLPRIREWKQGEAAKSLRLFINGMPDKIPPMRLHDLRAVFILEMLRSGKDIPTVMRIVHHARLETTMMYLALAGLDVANATEGLKFLDS